MAAGAGMRTERRVRGRRGGRADVAPGVRDFASSRYHRPVMPPSPNMEIFREVQQIAVGHGGRCLETNYTGITTPMLFECAEGHRWMTQGRSVRNNGSWCPTCAGSLPFTNEAAQALARERGGECLSKEGGTKTPMRWRCAKGHEWETEPRRILAGRWCPLCAGRPSLPYVQQVAAERGGRCVSRRYVNANAKMQWECAAGHRFTAIWRVVKAGQWCLLCKDKAHHRTLEDLQAMAAARGGWCLATKYRGMTEYIRWRCAEGHEWEAPPTVIRTNRWCPSCGWHRLTLEYMQKVAWERGGRCLSDEYKNSATQMLWECRNGHRWWAMPSNVVHKNSWCGKCHHASAKGERKNLR